MIPFQVWGGTSPPGNESPSPLRKLIQETNSFLTRLSNFAPPTCNEMAPGTLFFSRPPPPSLPKLSGGSGGSFFSSLVNDDAFQASEARRFFLGRGRSSDKIFFFGEDFFLVLDFPSC